MADLCCHGYKHLSIKNVSFKLKKRADFFVGCSRLRPAQRSWLKQAIKGCWAVRTPGSSPVLTGISRLKPASGRYNAGMRYRLRTLLIVVSAVAIFFGGYRLGYQHGFSGRFDHLIDLIQKILRPDSWDDL